MNTNLEIFVVIILMVLIMVFIVSQIGHYTVSWAEQPNGKHRVGDIFHPAYPIIKDGALATVTDESVVCTYVSVNPDRVECKKLNK